MSADGVRSGTGRVFLAGDTHGYIDIDKIFTWQKQNVGKGLRLGKKDLLVVLGDFGQIWGSQSSHWENQNLDYLEKGPFATLFIDGNHENFDRLLKYPESNMFGGKVGVIRPHVLHLKERGHIYNLYGNRCLCIGGATSHDKLYRTPQLSWWPEENIKPEEYARAYSELAANGNTVDYIFTHAGPAKPVTEYVSDGTYKADAPESIAFQKLSECASFKKWYFGHYHIDRHFECDGKKYGALYDNILELGK